ncbi:MAG TPA: hypothetical protein VJP77_05980 [Planctomycetota bacterium]|nr:hypothetical protein [Planctomycetota bacterium]
MTRRTEAVPAVWLLAAALAFASPAGAQGGPDLNTLVIDWASGRFASPVQCEMQGELVRGLRRVILRPHHTLGRPVRLAVHFVDMQPDGATRCVRATGTPLPNWQGKLLLQLSGKPHPETAQRDFERGLARDRGFGFEVTEGLLRRQDVAVPLPEPRLVDFRGGKASLHGVAPATDDERELAPFPSPRKLVLVVESPDGERIALPIFLASDAPL